VLAGNGPQKREWIEFKSWRFNSDNFNRFSNTLSGSRYRVWDGKSNTSNQDFRTNGHRQHFLDYMATLDSLQEHYWGQRRAEEFRDLKPIKNKAWIQVWERERQPRTWRALVRNGNRYTATGRKISRNVAVPWIDASGVITQTSREFQELQRFLTEPPSNVSTSAFEFSTGMTKSEYQNRHQSQQISSSAAEFSRSSVQPFTLLSFLVQEAGGNGRDLLHMIARDFMNEEFADLTMAIENGDLSPEQLQALRDQITDRILENLGPLEILAIDIPGLSDVENAVTDALLGESTESARKFVAEFMLPENLFENACEAQ